jgi:hypothetical protein
MRLNAPHGAMRLNAPHGATRCTDALLPLDERRVTIAFAVIEVALVEGIF